MTVLTPIVNAPSLYVNNLNLRQFDVNKYAISPGAARDSTNTNDIILSNDTVLTITVNGINGLDTGTLATSTLYAIYVIGDSSQKNPTGTIMSLSATAPTLPFGYDMFRRIAWGYVTSGSQTVALTQSGTGLFRQYFLNAPITALNAGAATSSTAVSLANIAPPTCGYVNFEVVFTANSASDIATFTMFNVGNAPVQRFGTGVAATQYGQIQLGVYGTPNRSFIYKVSSGSDSLTLNVMGYNDQL